MESDIRYRLTLPQRAADGGAPLIVGLHGCKQTAKDFAVGTRLDQRAADYGAAVLYPEQSKAANASGCWNWFLPEHQSRERGEPAAILQLVEEVSQRHCIDRSRVCVVGLSAGGAMAAILAEQAPDVFAGVGIMAGVALHRSHDVASAFAAMGAPRNTGLHLNASALPKFRLPNVPGLPLLSAPLKLKRSRLAMSLPTGLPNGAQAVPAPSPSAGTNLPPSAYARMRAMICAGTNDATVAPDNARALANQYAALFGLDASRPIRCEERREAEVTCWKDAGGTVRIELWTIPGMSHGWSGGSAKGSYTYPQGPDATDHMLQFFLQK